MPDTRGQSGIEHFEAYAKTMEETSSSTRFSTYSDVAGSGGDGHITLQTRGEPVKDVLAPDQEPPARKKASGKKKAKK